MGEHVPQVPSNVATPLPFDTAEVDPASVAFVGLVANARVTGVPGRGAPLPSFTIAWIAEPFAAYATLVMF
jgi:hypothetical protein